LIGVGRTHALACGAGLLVVPGAADCGCTVGIVGLA